MKAGRRAAWAIAAFAFTAAASLALFVTARVMSTRMLAKETRIVTNQLSARLEGCVTSRVEMLSQIRREWELGGLRDDDEFVVRVEALLRTFPGFQAVNRIDADGVIRFVYVGIAPDVLPRIYDPFFTTKGDGGSGLGLATVFSHVHRMNGQIEVTSEVGKGTRFAMTFPAHVAGAGA